ncbi:MAG: hypothetical protein ACTSWL_03230 [Promethearchaeota archaeon]
MVVLEIAIIYKEKSLLEHQFYTTDNILDKKLRLNLLESINALAIERFNDHIQAFSIGKYHIFFLIKDLQALEKSDKEKNKETQKDLDSLMMYCIVDSISEENLIKEAMEQSLFQFVNRFSLYDIHSVNLKKFKKFSKRFKDIFGDLVVNPEDRFKSVF